MPVSIGLLGAFSAVGSFSCEKLYTAVQSWFRISFSGDMLYSNYQSYKRHRTRWCIIWWHLRWYIYKILFLCAQWSAKSVTGHICCFRYVVQWGVATQNGYATSFPLTFPAQCLAVVATYDLQTDSSYWQYPLSVQNSARSSFTIATKSNWGANDTACWIAVGY